MPLDTSNNNSNPLDTLIDPSHYKKINWTPQLEDILIEWADKAMCFRWLHAKSNARYHLLNTRFTIPVIVISTLTGTANFAQERFGESVRPYVALIIGFFNILAGIIQTVQQFLKITELNEAHRVSSVAWDKFYRNIKTELAQEPDSRTAVGQMLKACKEEFDRLSETSPRIPDKIIVKFNEEFSGAEYKDISKPEICGSIKTTGKARFVEKLKVNFDNTLEAQQKKLLHAQQHKLDIITQFCDKYKQEKYRDPYVDEIYYNIKDEVDITKEEVEQLVKLKLSGKPLPEIDTDITSTKKVVQTRSEGSDVILDLDNQNTGMELQVVDGNNRKSDIKNAETTTSD
jgi:hypothetical protein